MEPIIYKYTDQEGAMKTLSNCSLLFRRPSDMNDPFDVYIDDLFGVDLKELSEESGDALFECLINNPALYAEKCGVDIKETIKITNLLANLSETERCAWKEFLKKNPFEQTDPKLRKIHENMQVELQHALSVFKTYGIFCATKKHDNLLMWAHYADEHRGVVFGFKPDVARDSFLTLMKPVIYSTERPVFMEESQLFFNNKEEFTNEELSARAMHRLLHTKSAEWSYEEELRLAIQDEIQEENKYSLLKFCPNELVDVYIGYRMDDKLKVKVISLAKILNPEVRIYSTNLVKRKYALEFNVIT